MICPACGHPGPDVMYDANGTGVWCARCHREIACPSASAVPALIVLIVAVVLAGGAVYMALFW